jgi:hypothetical protein
MPNKKMPEWYLKAEASILGKEQPRSAARGQGRKKPRVVYESVTRATTTEYFDRMLTDEMETHLWRVFLTGKAPVEEEVNGEKVVVIKDVELNPISWAAFKQAVAYKRGQPAVTLKSEDDKGKTKSVEITIIGATPEYFEKAAKARGLAIKSA